MLVGREKRRRPEGPYLKQASSVSPHRVHYAPQPPPMRHDQVAHGELLDRSIPGWPIHHGAGHKAWKSPADDVDGTELNSSNCTNVFMSRYIGPVFRQDGSCERIDLHLPRDRPEPGPFEAKLQATDPTE
jgi:hypothetical protein